MVLNKTQLFFFFLALLSTFIAFGQEEKERPLGNLNTPFDALYTFTFYADEGNFQKASKPFKKNPKKAIEFSIKLKQVLDGKGLKIRISNIPENENFLDSTTQKHVYFPFPNEYPEIYLEKSKQNGKWFFSYETLREIPKIHRTVFPFGSHMLLEWLPQIGQKSILGLYSWQYFTMILMVIIGIIIHFILSRLFGFTVKWIANSRLGKNHFDEEPVKRMGIIFSYLLIFYLVYLFVPILQLSSGFTFYILLGLRVSNTILLVLLALRTISLIKSSVLYNAKNQSNGIDEHIVPVISRIVNVVIITAGIIHLLSIFYVNVTALVAGLSIGGLALALAAQETVKNLFGSLMIYADKPFKIGDLVSVGSITGTIEDIGFRSTRIRTFDTSLISVPNGNLMNETINNLGQRKQRRFYSVINIAYHTPPHLMEIFIEGMRQIAMEHPHVDKENVNIRLNNLGNSSLDILVVIFFNTNVWEKEIEWKEEIIYAFVELASQVGIQFAFPSTSIYVETVPEKKSNLPEYNQDKSNALTQKNLYLEQYKQKFKETEIELESSDSDN